MAVPLGYCGSGYDDNSNHKIDEYSSPEKSHSVVRTGGLGCRRVHPTWESSVGQAARFGGNVVSKWIKPTAQEVFLTEESVPFALKVRPVQM